jgi:two-component system, OmpR family, response regulator
MGSRRTDDQNHTLEPRPAPGMSDPGVLQRILVVEDDPDILTIAKIALETLGGFTVLACTSAADALAGLPAFSPDLVLLDVMMPGMDGPTAFAALRALPAGGRVPVIFVTAKVQAQEVARYLEMGAADVIAKPFDPLALADQVRAIWSRSRQTGPAERRGG